MTCATKWFLSFYRIPTEFLTVCLCSGTTRSAKKSNYRREYIDVVNETGVLGGDEAFIFYRVHATL